MEKFKEGIEIVITHNLFSRKFAVSVEKSQLRSCQPSTPLIEFKSSQESGEGLCLLTWIVVWWVVGKQRGHVR